MPQQALRRHHYERFAPAAFDLPPQEMEILRRRGWDSDLDVVLGSERQKALQPGARVLGSAPFESMRQKQNQATQPPPFCLGADEELVDHHLGRVGEVAI